MDTKQELEKFADFRDDDKIWIFIERVENGQSVMLRRSSGFSAIELLGLAHLSERDIMSQISGEIKPDIIKRELLAK